MDDLQGVVVSTTPVCSFAPAEEDLRYLGHHFPTELFSAIAESRNPRSTYT